MMYLSKNEIALVLKTLPHDSYVTLQENFKFSAHQSKLGASRMSDVNNCAVKVILLHVHGM